MKKKKRIPGRSPSIDQGNIAMFGNSKPKYMKQKTNNDILPELSSLEKHKFKYNKPKRGIGSFDDQKSS